MANFTWRPRANFVGRIDLIWFSFALLFTTGHLLYVTYERAHENTSSGVVKASWSMITYIFAIIIPSALQIFMAHKLITATTLGVDPIEALALSRWWLICQLCFHFISIAALVKDVMLTPALILFFIHAPMIGVVFLFSREVSDHLKNGPKWISNSV